MLNVVQHKIKNKRMSCMGLVTGDKEGGPFRKELNLTSFRQSASQYSEESETIL